MAHEPFFLITASASWMLSVFVCSVLIFHVVFLKLWKLGAIGWKRVDYVWLAMATLGLLGGVSEVRRVFAVGQIATEQSLVQSTFEDLRHEIRFLNSAAVCRQFIRGEFSPPDFDAIQKEYDAVCDFAKRILGQLPEGPPADLSQLHLDDRPHVTAKSLLDTLKGLDDRAAWYRRARKTYDDTVEASGRTSFESSALIMAPLLLAVALALRITKVTGEIRLKA